MAPVLWATHPPVKPGVGRSFLITQIGCVLPHQMFLARLDRLVAPSRLLFRHITNDQGVASREAKMRHLAFEGRAKQEEEC